MDCFVLFAKKDRRKNETAFREKKNVYVIRNKGQLIFDVV